MWQRGTWGALILLEKPPHARMSPCVPSRFRGWLVRRVCGFLAAWEWKIPAESPGELLVRICSSQRWVGAVGGSQDHPHSPPVRGDPGWSLDPSWV